MEVHCVGHSYNNTYDSRSGSNAAGWPFRVLVRKSLRIETAGGL
jgi:hypothetical protein